MTSIDIELTAWETLRQQQQEQVEGALQRLYQQILQELEQLREQEQAMMDAQTAALASLRPLIEADARCLLSTRQFQQFINMLTVDRKLFMFRSSPTLVVTTEPSTWLLTTQALPVEIISYEMIQDNSAYNDENYYTDYRYQLTTQFGSWQKTVSISTASLHPGNPIRYHLNSLRNQHYEVAYELMERSRSSLDVPPQSDPPSSSEFPLLSLDEAQIVQLKQELSCLITFVGDLFTIDSRVERFRYPSQRWLH